MKNSKINFEYYRSLPRKRMAAAVLIFNTNEEILIIKPSYKDHWSIPGGVIEKDESPKAGCPRETKEETDLVLNDIRLVCVDYISNKGGKGDNLQFLFFGGKLSESEIQNIKLDGKEIVDYRFMHIDDALPLLSEKMNKRLSRGMDALKDGVVLYLENGERF